MGFDMLFLISAKVSDGMYPQSLYRERDCILVYELKRRGIIIISLFCLTTYDTYAIFLFLLEFYHNSHS